jgi:circadian clock protein KaiB
MDWQRYHHSSQELSVNHEKSVDRKKDTTTRQLRLRLYVADDAPNSVEAVANLRAICDSQLERDAYRLEIIDVLEEPLRALDDGVLVTPTLIGVWSASVPVKILGTLRDRNRVKQALGLT